MADRIDLIVARRLRARRRLLGMTQGDLARACGVSFQQVHKYESAGSRISANMLFRMACALDVDIGFFFRGVQPAGELANGPAPEPRAVSRAA